MERINLLQERVNEIITEVSQINNECNILIEMLNTKLTIDELMYIHNKRNTLRNRLNELVPEYRGIIIEMANIQK